MLELLLERNQALINYKDSQGMTPLAIACIKGYKYIVDVLLRYPILDVMKKLGFNNDTALHFAKCPFIHTKVFMRYGICTNVTNSIGETPFMNYVQALLLDPTVVFEEECNVILLYLEKVPNLIYEYNEGNYVRPSNGMVNKEYKLIHQIIRLNNPQLLEIVLDTMHDASDIINDATNKDGLTPLHLTCGAIMEQNRNTGRPLKTMEWNRNTCRRKLLQLSCIDVNKKSKIGCTALHFACYSKNRAAVEDLIHHSNTILNLYDLAGRTPLHATMIANEYTYDVYLAISKVMTVLLNHEESLVLTQDNDGHTIKHILYGMIEALPRTQTDSRVEFREMNKLLENTITCVITFEAKARWKIMQFISGREMND
jgi:ankyrin repeat protein